MIVKAVQGRRSIKVRRIYWKGRFWAWSERVKEWWMMRVVMMTEMSWQVNEEVSRDMTGEADGINRRDNSRDGLMHIWMNDMCTYDSHVNICLKTLSRWENNLRKPQGDKFFRLTLYTKHVSGTIFGLLTHRPDTLKTMPTFAIAADTFSVESAMHNGQRTLSKNSDDRRRFCLVWVGAVTNLTTIRSPFTDWTISKRRTDLIDFSSFSLPNCPYCSGWCLLRYSLIIIIKISPVRALTVDF